LRCDRLDERQVGRDELVALGSGHGRLRAGTTSSRHGYVKVGVTHDPGWRTPPAVLPYATPAHTMRRIGSAVFARFLGIGPLLGALVACVSVFRGALTGGGASAAWR